MSVRTCSTVHEELSASASHSSSRVWAQKGFCLQADLAGRDFTAERGEAVVISTGAAVSVQDLERTARERAVAQVSTHQSPQEIVSETLQKFTVTHR